MTNVMKESAIPELVCKRGKVRDKYDLGDERLLLVTTDRISAFDWVLPNGIPHKGRVLHGLSMFWFQQLGFKNHVVSDAAEDLMSVLGDSVDDELFGHLLGRSMIVQKVTPCPVECIVRGYLDGSGWKEYQESGTVCGIELPQGLQRCQRLPLPLFTPSTKAESGHDINITYEQMRDVLGEWLGIYKERRFGVAARLKFMSLELYEKGAALAKDRGIIIADTKFEFGLPLHVPMEPESLIVIDEVLTPDSSRFWPADGYEVGRSQPSFDKQFVRDWLTDSGWDRDSEPPTLPDEVIIETSQKYMEAYQRLTGKVYHWCDN